jgi:site-specific recombinase XerD
MSHSHSLNANVTAAIPEQTHSQMRRSVAAPRRQRASTKAAYEKDVSRFIQSYGGTIPCSPDELIRFITALVKRVAPVTIARRCQSIRDAHVRGGHTPPTDDVRIREAMRWMVAGHLPHNLQEPSKSGKKSPQVLSKAVKPKRVAKIIDRALLNRMFDCMGTGMRSMDRRDKAILLLGYAGLKRGAICAINIEDLTFTQDAMLIRVAATQEAGEQVEERPSESKARVMAIPFTRGPLCAATACQTWLKHNDLEGKTGALFPSFTRSGEPTTDRLASAYVSVIIKERLKAAGIADVSAYSGESLRRGHAAEMVKGRKS